MDKFEALFRWVWGNLAAAAIATIVWSPIHYVVTGKFIGQYGFVNFFAYLFVFFSLFDIVVKAWRVWRNPA